ncbi:N-acetyltransferase (plasmid) [Fulvitalea axinellae]|uniref:N-acetyltransferase n=1 Tax=Fulvitalea axinellae TaxID=1182444 RepID=A0AAU9DJN5_9BACT|nr:N-acetyltransferase [Fulvitalea axinellae]
MTTTIVDIKVEVTEVTHERFADEICEMIEASAKQRGTGIAKRSVDYIRTKISDGKAVIAFSGSEVAGFCYIETWEHGRYVVNSGLIVNPAFRGQGVAKKIKKRIFRLSRELYPQASIFGITTSAQVMRINSELGYRPVTFSELTSDKAFWQGCGSCRNFDILQRTDRKYCLCTGMVYRPENDENKQ